jgi:hypothetical protein
MQISTPLPYFPVPPAQYTQTYMAEVTRSFSTFLTQYQNTIQQDEGTAIAWFMG